MTNTINTPPILGPIKFRMLPKKLTTKARPEHHQKRLFVPVYAFEVLDFPVRVPRIESLGNEMHRGMSDSFAIKKVKPSGCYA
jgi:hypothetical protein